MEPCMRQTEQCQRKKNIYEGHCFDRDQSFMNIKINTPVLKATDDLLSIMLENTAACLADKNSQKILDCIRLRNKAQYYLRNCGDAREDFVKTCVPSVLLFDESRPQKCRKYDRGHQKALHVYTRLWYQCIRKTQALYESIKFSNRQVPADLTHEMESLFADTMKVYFSEIVKFLSSDLHPLFRLVIEQDSSDDDFPALIEEDEEYSMPNPNPSNPADRLLSLHFMTEIHPGPQDLIVELSLGTLGTLLDACSGRMSTMMAAINTIRFWAFNKVITPNHSNVVNMSMDLEIFRESTVVDSLMQLPSSRILLFQFMSHYHNLVAVDEGYLYYKPTFEKLMSILDFPEIISILNKRENRGFVKTPSDDLRLRPTALIYMLFSKIEAEWFVQYAADKIFLGKSTDSIVKIHGDFGAKGGFDMLERAGLRSKRRVQHLVQKGDTMFQLRSDLREGDDLLKDVHYWVNSEGFVTSLFRGNLVVTDDGDVTITCSKIPTKRVWKQIFIPGLNDSYMDKTSHLSSTNHLNDEIMKLALKDGSNEPFVKQKSGEHTNLKFPPTFVQKETWTFMKDVRFTKFAYEV